MKRIKSQLLPFERMTREPYHYLRSYYDLQHWSPDGNSLLCHRTAFRDRLQAPQDRTELGMIRLSDYCFIQLAETYAWNFQQGSMLQWLPSSSGKEIIYNVGLNEQWCAVIKNIENGKCRVLHRPIRSISPNGKYALSINYSRIFDQRPGYGYAGIPDPWKQIECPSDDGIYLIDLETGTDKLIISVADAVKMLPESPETRVKLLINAATFNTDGTRFMFLLRTMERPTGTDAAGCWWKTAVFTADRDGSDLHCMIPFSMVSHNNWRDPEHLLVYADCDRQNCLYLIKDKSSEVTRIDCNIFHEDGHCSYSPDRKYILYDSYPDTAGYRKIYLYDIAEQTPFLLAELLSEQLNQVSCVDVRCDLHPSWNREGTAITFESVHEGNRHIYHMDLTGLIC